MLAPAEAFITAVTLMGETTTNRVGKHITKAAVKVFFTGVGLALIDQRCQESNLIIVVMSKSESWMQQSGCRKSFVSSASLSIYRESSAKVSNLADVTFAILPTDKKMGRGILFRRSKILAQKFKILPTLLLQFCFLINQGCKSLKFRIH